jgi:4a-hydroxytetrahydrobiopterin dehydratase
MSLQDKHCKPCEDNTPPLSSAEAEELVEEIDQWTIEDDKKLEKVLVFKDFRQALDFVDKVGAIAERENHHPDISIFDYKKVRLVLFTHAIGGLSENDFILAAKIDDLLRQR